MLFPVLRDDRSDRLLTLRSEHCRNNPVERCRRRVMLQSKSAGIHLVHSIVVQNNGGFICVNLRHLLHDRAVSLVDLGREMVAHSTNLTVTSISNFQKHRIAGSQQQRHRRDGIKFLWSAGDPPTDAGHHIGETSGIALKMALNRDSSPDEKTHPGHSAENNLTTFHRAIFAPQINFLAAFFRTDSAGCNYGVAILRRRKNRLSYCSLGTRRK